MVRWAATLPPATGPGKGARGLATRRPAGDTPDVDEVDASASDGGPAATVARQLLDYLLYTGDLRPGDRLPPERRLTEAFGVGRSAVREAIALLNVLGLVEVRHGSGTYLKASDSPLLPDVLGWSVLLGPRRLDEAVEVHHLLERELVRLAARRHHPDDRRRLRRHLDDLRAAGSDAAEAARAERAFHATLADLAGNATLAALHGTSAALLRDWHASVLRQRRDHGLTVAEHEAIVTTIESGDPDLATRAMDAHFAAERQRVAGISGSR